MNKSFILEGISIDHPAADVFKFVSDRNTLPLWTKAFKKITPHGAEYETPGGTVPIGLDVIADRDSGVVDWVMKFPDGTVDRAFGRVVAENATRANVQFFFAPMLPPEGSEEAIKQLSATIREEFAVLKQTLDQSR
jgi:hypothetical protein